MNENVDLTKILKDCPEGFELYSTIFGPVTFVELDLEEDQKFQIIMRVVQNKTTISFTKEGKYLTRYRDAECCLFPSKDQRDWNKFSAPWYKKKKFDPKTLQPFDRVLVRDYNDDKWVCSIFSHIEPEDCFHYECILELNCRYCIPYNDDTKHLVGTTEEAPEYYRYWED